MENMKNLIDTEVLIKNAALEAVRLYKKEEKDRKKQMALHNTEELLENYIELRYFYKHCIDSDYKTSSYEIVSNSLRTKRVITFILYYHAKRCLRRLKEQEKEKYKVIHMLYIDTSLSRLSLNDKMIKIQESLHISERTVRNWKNEMIRKLSIMFYGADGLWVILD